MMGIPDAEVWLAYLLCVASSLLCVVYAWRNWDRGGDEVTPDDIQWQREEQKVEENL